MSKTRNNLIVKCLVLFVAALVTGGASCLTFAAENAKAQTGGRVYTEADGAKISAIEVSAQPMYAGSNYEIKFSYDFASPQTEGRFNAGDRLIYKHNLAALFDVTDWSSLQGMQVYDENLKKIGTMDINKNGTIVITFNKTIEKKTIVSGRTETGFYFIPKDSQASEEGVSRTIVIGGASKAVTFKIYKAQKYRAVDQDVCWKNAFNGTGNSYFDITVNTLALDKFYMNNGTSLVWNGFDHSKRSVILEDTIPAKGVLKEKDLNIYGCLSGMFRDDDGMQRAKTGPDWQSVKARFQKMEPREEESYQSFSERIKKQSLSYGIFMDKQGNYSFIINFGDIPGNGIKYADYYPDPFDGQLSILNPGNCINGEYLSYEVTVKTDYPKLFTRKKLTNTATFSYVDSQGRQQVHKRWSDYMVSSGSSMLTKGEGTLSLQLFDQNSVDQNLQDQDKWRPLSGAVFQVQKKNSSGSWENYQQRGVAAKVTTDSNGQAVFGILPDGEYRLIQIKASSGYEKDSLVFLESDVNEDGTFVMDADKFPDGLMAAAVNKTKKVPQAKEEKVKDEKVTLSFDSRGGNYTPKEQVLERGSVPKEPKAPTKEEG